MRYGALAIAREVLVARRATASHSWRDSQQGFEGAQGLLTVSFLRWMAERMLTTLCALSVLATTAHDDELPWVESKRAVIPEACGLTLVLTQVQTFCFNEAKQVCTDGTDGTAGFSEIEMLLSVSNQRAKANSRSALWWNPTNTLVCAQKKTSQKGGRQRGKRSMRRSPRTSNQKWAASSPRLQHCG